MKKKKRVIRNVDIAEDVHVPTIDKIIQEEGKPTILHGIKILGMESKNGRRYTDSAMSNAVTKYEGAAVNVDHPEKEGARSFRDRIGTVEGVHHRPGNGLFANVQCNSRHPDTATLVGWVESNPSAVGFSHSIRAKGSVDADKKFVVEEIMSVNSVDLVTNPATTAGLFEQTEPEEKERGDTVEFAELTLEEIAKKRPDLARAMQESQKDADAQKALLEERDALKKANEEFTMKETVAVHCGKVDALLKESKLPKTAVTEEWKAFLYAADLEAVTKMIEERKTLVGSIGTTLPKSKEQNVKEGDGTIYDGIDAKGFVQRLRMRSRKVG